jgi:glycosyltransferase involved in cell wall biosynthesis
VHSAAIADQLQAENPDAAVDTIHLGHGTTVAAERATRARRRVRARYGIPEDAVLFGSFGGLAPDKRIPQILDALAAVLPYAPSARLLLAGTSPEHYDLRADVAARQLTDRVHLTGYLDSDDELTDCIAAVDVALTLRWPTARETSGPWLRCLAAGRATVISDLVQTACVPALDPRTWTVAATGEREPEPICVAVDILDEDHSLRLAMRRLAADPGLRGRLGEAAQAYWRREHSVERMVDDYRRVIGRAVDRPAPAATLPAHATDTGERLLRTLVAPFGLPSPLE